jgi:hypothetical protein
MIQMWRLEITARSCLTTLISTAESDRFLAGVADHVVGNFGALGEAVHAGLLDRRDMDEYVLATAVRRDEALAFFAGEPFHCSTR